MKNTEITEATLFRYFTGQMSNEETDALTAWYGENPEEHRKIMDRAHALYIVSTMSEPAADEPDLRSAGWRSGWRRMVRQVSGIAAVLLLGFGASYYLFSQKLESWAARPTVIEAPLGQHIRLTLSDGTSVDLNSGSRLTCPSVFAGRQRRVQLEGEAMFDVAHDASHPFVVETFACDVSVLGTRFNVIADEAQQEFSAALFEGRVSVVDRSSGERVELVPDRMAALKNGRLQTSAMTDPDSYRWTEGVISLSGLSFEQVIRKLEKAYGVKLSVERSSLPEIKYRNIKVRVSDGIEHALDILQKASDFSYEYDESGTAIIIR